MGSEAAQKWCLRMDVELMQNISAYKGYSRMAYFSRLGIYINKHYHNYNHHLSHLYHL